MVMMGHDVVPHLHDEEHATSDHSTLPHSSNNGLPDLENAFSHFQHSTDEKHLVYLGASEKKANSQINNFYHPPFGSTLEYPLVWYSNYKKQRFWEYVIVSSRYVSNSSSLRGPPSC